MRRIWSVLVVLATCGPTTRADWWYTYEASEGTFPEQQGWQRNTDAGGAQRWLEDGAFVLDASADPAIIECYSKGMESLPDPDDPTHAFVCDWRIRVDGVNGLWNPEMFVAFQGYGDIALEYKMDCIYSLHEGEYIAEFEPGVFHSYRFLTTDIETYTLAIDGTVVYTGQVSPWAPASWVEFGDNSPTDSSNSRWDYLRYGVIQVPEPGSIVLCVAAILGAPNRLRRRTR
jgi:hypothetical protein